MEVRKVQQVGYSTLVVSLPRGWAKEVGLKQGDIVSFERDDDVGLHLYPGIINEERLAIRCVVDADQCVEKGLLARIITGSYIMGHDTIEITSRKELSQERLAEIRRATQRLTGIGIVEQSLRHVIIQCFIDPTKFPLEGLLRRLYVITSSMQSATMQAIRELRRDLAVEAIHMEDEIDRIYWLAVRQLLLAAKDKNIAKRMGVGSPQQLLGSRVIAKALEKIGDLSEAMAKDSLRIIEAGPLEDQRIIDRMAGFAQTVQGIFDGTIKALFAPDIKLANSVIESVESVEREERSLMESALLKVQRSGDRVVEGHALPLSLLVGLRGLVLSLGHIARYCSTIAEIAINRTLEQSNSICRCEKM